MERFGLRIDVWQGILVFVVALGITIKLFRCVKWSRTGSRRKCSNWFFFFNSQRLVVVLRFQIGAFYFVLMSDTNNIDVKKRCQRTKQKCLRGKNVSRINRPPMSGERLSRSLLKIRLYVQTISSSLPLPKRPIPVRPRQLVYLVLAQGQLVSFQHFHSSFNLYF